MTELNYSEENFRKLYEALKAFDKYLSTPPPDNMKYKRHAVNLMDEALASVDRKGEGK